MIFVWGIMIFNFFQPFPKPLKYFMDIAMVFTVVMHAFQLLLLKHTQPKGQKLSAFLQTKIFFFGVFELLNWQKKERKKEQEKK
ncbi:membrane protein [Xenorhabdus szentirmaii]|nr:membrane protein [Xenorhabdus szentirmaii DSM 16338]PHM43584.1 membrane protein [Xenorhabdus szentirmaii]